MTAAELPLPGEIYAFIGKRLPAVSKEIPTVFYKPVATDEPETQDFGPLPEIMTGGVESFDKIRLRMKICPEPLPAKTKSDDLWSGGQPKCIRYVGQPLPKKSAYVCSY